MTDKNKLVDFENKIKYNSVPVVIGDKTLTYSHNTQPVGTQYIRTTLKAETFFNTNQINQKENFFLIFESNLLN